MDVHEGHRDRLKNKYLNYGMDSFENHEVLELLLYFCIPRKDTNALAHRLIDTYGNISTLFEASPKDISNRCEVSINTAILISLTPHLSRIYNHDKFKKKIVLDNSTSSGEYVKSLFEGRCYENFILICLDKSNRVLNNQVICEGTIDEIPMYPRIVVEAALSAKATRVILAHNHPGGNLKPSVSDKETTRTLISVFSSIGIEVGDHIIVADNNALSMADLGFI